MDSSRSHHAAASSSSGGSSSGSAAAPSTDKILKEVMHKITQIIANSSHLNRWFNLHVPEWVGVRGELDLLLRDRSGVADLDRSNGGSMTASQMLTGPAQPVTSALIQLDLILRNPKHTAQYVLVERWTMQHERHPNDLSDNSSSLAASKKTNPPDLYKKLILLVRSLYSFTKLLPCQTAWRTGQAALERRDAAPFVMSHQLSTSDRPLTMLIRDGLCPPSTYPLIPTPVFDREPTIFNFNTIPTPMGRFNLSVYYRPELTDIDFLQAAGVSLGYSSSSSTRSVNPPLHSPSSSLSSSSSVVGGGIGATPAIATGGTTIISDYMAAPDANRTNRTANGTASATTGDAPYAVGSPNTSADVPLAAPELQQQSSQPKSGLSLGLEKHKQMLRENSGNANAGVAAPPSVDSPQSSHTHTQPASFHQHDRRHTLPVNQAGIQLQAFQQQQQDMQPYANQTQYQTQQQQQQQQQYPSHHQHSHSLGPRTDRSQSVIHSSSYTGGGVGIPFSSPHAHPPPHGRSRADSDSSDSALSNIPNSISTSKPMSIPRGASGGGNSGGQMGVQPSSVPNQRTNMHMGVQPQSHQHHPHAHQLNQSTSSQHSVSSDPPSFNNSFTPHSVGSLGPTAYSPSNFSYLPQSVSSGVGVSGFVGGPNFNGMPSNSSGSNLAKLPEEDGIDEAAMTFGSLPNQQGFKQQMYDGTPSGSQVGVAGQRLPHSHSQPSHLAPTHRPASSSGTLPLAGGYSSSPSSSRRGSGGFGSTPPDINKAKPPLAANTAGINITGGTSYSSSSRTSANFSPSFHPMSSPTHTPLSSGPIIRDRDAFNVGSIPRSTVTFAPPILGTSYTHQRSDSSASTGTSPHQTFYATSPSSSPTPNTFGSSGGTAPIPIATKSLAGSTTSGRIGSGSTSAVGSISTPPFATAGSAFDMLKTLNSSHSPPAVAIGFHPPDMAAHRGSVGSWKGATMVPPPPVTINPFKPNANGGRKSVVGSPAMTPQMIHLTANAPPQFDLAAAVHSPDGSHTPAAAHRDDDLLIHTNAFASRALSDAPHVTGVEVNIPSDDDGSSALGRLIAHLDSMHDQPLDLFLTPSYDPTFSPSMGVAPIGSSGHSGVMHTSLQQVYEGLGHIETNRTQHA